MNDITINRFKRFEKWLKWNDFDKLMYRLTHEHGDEWCEKCRSNGDDVYANNKLKFVIEYIKNNYTPIKNDLCFDSSCQVWKFKGYLFKINNNIQIYNCDDLRCILKI